MRRSLLSLLFVFTLLMAACAPAAPADTGGGSEAMAEDMASDMVLNFGMDAADLGTLDPHFAATTNDRTIVDMVFNALVRYTPGQAPNIEADLAEAVPEPELTDDGKQVWTFNLRAGVMCHAGPETEAYELTSADVVYSLTKSANPDRSAYASAYDGWVIEAPDESTVTITLDQPLSPVLFLPNVADYAGGFIVCSEAIEAMGDEVFKTHPVGTGPFVFESYFAQDAITLAGNADYFRGAPMLSSVNARFMPDLNSRNLGMQAGELHVIAGVSESAWIQDIQGQDGYDVDIFGPGEVGTIHFNQSVEPLDNLQVRQAIAYALDRGEFKALFAPEATGVAYSPVPSDFMIGGLTEEDATSAGLDYSYDLDKAKALMEEAGYADGFDLEVASSEKDFYRRFYESMQSQLSAININMTVNIVDHSSMHSLIREDANPIVVYGAFRPNADVYLTRFYLSDSIVVSGAKPDTNFSHYTGIDDMILSARFETDADAQTQMWKDAQTQLLEEMVAHSILYTQQVYARSSNIDYGHEALTSTLNLYPQFTEKTMIK